MTEVHPSDPPAKGRFWRGMARGISGKCPNCGQGRLYSAYLKIQPRCSLCGHDNSQYRADDAGPYFTILITGHLVVGPMLFFPFIWKAPLMLVIFTTLPILAVVILVLLPVVKGAVVGALWALRQGKDEAEDAAVTADQTTTRAKLKGV